LKLAKNAAVIQNLSSHPYFILTYGWNVSAASAQPIAEAINMDMKYPKKMQRFPQLTNGIQ
jgi:hypothetical protein